MPKLPIHSILVEYGRKEYTLNLLADLLKEGSSAVTIVDNGSFDSAESISDLEVAELLTGFIKNIDAEEVLSNGHYLPVRLIRSRQNLGFGAGVNSALTSVGGFQVGTVIFEIQFNDNKLKVTPRNTEDIDESLAHFWEDFHQPYILISNNDIRIKHETLKTLVSILKENKNLAIVAPKLLNPDNSVYPSARRFPSLITAVGYALTTITGRNSSNRFVKSYKSYESFPLIDKQNGIYSVDWVSGAFLVMDYMVFEQLGGFDEGYFLYLEDVDLCFRVKELAKQVGYATNCEVLHVGSVSISDEGKKAYYHHMSAFRFEKKTAKGLRKALLPAATVFLGLRGFAVVVLARIKSRTFKKMG